MMVSSRSPYGQRSAPAQAPVVVYGTRWCAATQAVRRFLDRMGIPDVYLDLDENPRAADQVRWVAGGTASHPTVSVAGEVLVEPSLNELKYALARAGLI